MAKFDVAPLAAKLGASVTGLDLATDSSESVVRPLIDLLHARGVLVIRNQRFDEGDFIRFARAFSASMAASSGEARSPDVPELIRIGNDPGASPARESASHWHSDGSHEPEPPAATLLYGKEAPREGGELKFANTAAAYEALPTAMKAQVEELVALHRPAAAPWIGGEVPPDPCDPALASPAQRHPLVVRHPVTGRRAIFTSGTAYGIDGMAQKDATHLIRLLRRHVVKPEFRAKVQIAPGEVVLWDNYSTVHRAVAVEQTRARGKRRLFYRVSISAAAALCSA